MFGRQFFADKRKKKSTACSQRVFARVPRRLLQLTMSGRRRERREDILSSYVQETTSPTVKEQSGPVSILDMFGPSIWFDGDFVSDLRDLTEFDMIRS